MKYPFLFSISVLLISFSSANAQPSVSFQKSFGGTGSDWALSIDETSDGGHVMSGWTGSSDGDVTLNHGGYDCWIVRLDANDSLLWQKSLGGTQTDIAYSIDQTTDGGFIIGAVSYSMDGDVLSHHGNISSSDFWIVKLDSLGNIVWRRSLGGSGDDEPFSIQHTSDGGCIVAGYTLSIDGDVTGLHGSNDYWVVKLDATGLIQWQKTLGGSQIDQAFFVRQAQDGGYIVTGHSKSNNGDVTGHHGTASTYDYWVVKLNSAGNLEWQKSLGGSADDESWGVVQTADLGYAVAGFSYSTDGDVTGVHGSEDFWIVKLNPTGGIEWQKALGGTAHDEAWAIGNTIDNGLVVAGYTNSTNGDVTALQGFYDQWVLKLDALGNLQWQKAIGGPGDDAAYAVALDANGGCVIAGRSQNNGGNVTNNHGDYDFWMVRLDNVLSLETASPFNIPLTVYPNPGKGTFKLSLPESVKENKIRIQSVTGEILLEDVMGAGVQSLQIANAAPGMYFVRVENASANYFARLIITD